MGLEHACRRVIGRVGKGCFWPLAAAVKLFDAELRMLQEKKYIRRQHRCRLKFRPVPP